MGLKGKVRTSTTGHYHSVDSLVWWASGFFSNLLRTIQSWIMRFLPTGTREHHERSKNINVRTPAKCILSFTLSVQTSLVLPCTGVAAVEEDLFNPLKRNRLREADEREIETKSHCQMINTGIRTWENNDVSFVFEPSLSWPTMWARVFLFTIKCSRGSI